MVVLEQMIYESAVQSVGDPIILGLLTFGFFLGFVAMQGQRLEGKIFVLVPALILSLAFMPPVVTILAGLILGGILYLALRKLNSG